MSPNPALVLRALLAIGMFAASPALAQPAATAEALRSDLARFRSDFLARDKSYAPAQRAEATARLDRLESMLGSLSPVALELELARIVALADNGHTSSSAARRSPRYNRVALRFVPFGADFHVLRAGSSHSDLLGGRLVAIDGQPIADVRRVAHSLWGGTAAFRDRHVPFLLESPGQMQALGIASSADGATYRLALPEGRTVERRIVAEPADPSRERNGSGRWLSPDPLPSDRDAWKHLVAPHPVPWALREVGQPFRWRVAGDLDAIVVQLRANRDAGRSISSFLDSVTRVIRRERPRHLVLDMRANGGGDLNTTRDFMQALPGLVPGRIFALTSPWTFSAAISSVGYLKQAAGARLTIVGEMVGDRLEFWAEGGPVFLPATGASANVSTERHDYRTGCRPYRDCHGSVVRHPISVASLAPDIDAPLTFAAYVAGRDPAMEAVAAALLRAR
jgi:hypothetical protein